VLGIYGQRDSSVTPQLVHELEDQLKKLGKSFEVHIYPGVGHAFFNDARPEVYNAEAAGDAWRRTNEFFKKNLQ
jgi:carboxymethylenebutenolidase